MRPTVLERFRRIRRVFGAGEFARVVVLIAGLVGMSVFGLVGFSSPVAALTVAGGLVIGYFFRRRIARGAEIQGVAVPVALFVYGVVLFGGDRLGWDRQYKLLVITVVTVVVFDLKFWTLSDPGTLPATAFEDRE